MDSGLTLSFCHAVAAVWHAPVQVSAALCSQLLQAGNAVPGLKGKITVQCSEHKPSNMDSNPMSSLKHIVQQFPLNLTRL